MLSRVVDNTFCCNLNNRNTLREVIVKIGLERIDTSKGVIVETLLDSEVTELVMSSEFARKQGFKLKKIERPIYIRNVDRSFNKKGPIEHTIEVNIYYQEYRKRTEIDIIREQKWSVILGMLQLAHHNPEIDWRTGEVKITRCPEEYGKQWRLKQKKSRWQKQKEEEKRRKEKEARREGTEKEEKGGGCKEDSRRMENMG